MIKNYKVINNLTEMEYKWSYLPVRGFWYGTIKERCIEIIKTDLKRILGRTLVTRAGSNTKGLALGLCQWEFR